MNSCSGTGIDMLTHCSEHGQQSVCGILIIKGGGGREKQTIQDLDKGRVKG